MSTILRFLAALLITFIVIIVSTLLIGFIFQTPEQKAWREEQAEEWRQSWEDGEWEPDYGY